MLYKPLVLLHRLAPEEVELLIKQNSTPSNINNSQPKNVRKCPKCLQTNSILSAEKGVIAADNSVSPLEKQQQCTLRVLSNNSNDLICDGSMDKKLLRKQKFETSLNDYTNIFKKELLVVLDNSYNVTIDTAQHPKRRNSKVAVNCNSINSSTSVQTSTAVNEHITDESASMTTKSTFTEAIDKHTRGVTLDNQMTADKPDKQTNYETLVHHDSSGLNLRTRTISSTVYTSLQKSTISAISVQSNCQNSSVNVPRRRGRPPKNLTRIAEKKLLEKNIDKHSEKTKSADSNAITKTDGASSNDDCLQQQLINKSTVLDDLSNEVSRVLPTDVASVNDGVGTSSSFVFFGSQSSKNGSDCTDDRDLSLQVDKNKECIVSGKKKNNIRKRKQSTDIEETVAEKCILISSKSKDPLMATNNEPIQSKSTAKQNVTGDTVKYGFLLGCDIESYRKCTDLNESSSYSSIFYGNTYWPINWEYSASALTSHVQKKTSKITLRKIRLMSDVKTQLSSKTTPTLKKFQSSVAPRRCSSSKLTLSSSSAPVETSNGVRHAPTPTKKRIGRPPGKKNKLLQAVIKSNSPRKSPRQHASTLAAIMSNKALKTEFGTQQPDKLMDGEPKNSLDSDGPCVLTAMPNYDRKPEVRLYRRRVHSDQQHDTIKSRGQCRSSTPTPPKLCAEQPFSQRDPVNGVTVDHDIVKLRTKHVDLIKRRARDERVQTNYIFQQLRKVYEIAEQNLRDLSLAVTQTDDGQESSNVIVLPSSDNQNSIWSSLTTDGTTQEPDNMCLQIMYEQTGDKRFLCTDLTDETLKMYHEQRDLILDTCGDYVSSDMGTDAILASNKRKKKRPNMTGWPKEKRRKIMARTVDVNSDSDVDILAKRQKAAEQQRLRRRRIKLEQQQLNKEKSKVSNSPKATPKQQSSNKKNKTTAYRRSTNLNNAPKNIKKIKEKKKYKIKKVQQQCVAIQNKTVKAVPSTGNGKKSCGRPKGSVGIRQRLKLELLQQRKKETPLLSEQQKENVSQPTTTSGEFKCIISTRNNSIKLLSSNSSSSENLSRKRKLVRTKKSTATYNLSSSTLESLPSAVTVKRKRRKQESVATSTITWDVGRPKRYHNRNTSVGVEEEFCLVGSQPFEQHCPGVPLMKHNTTVLENNQDQKENTIHI